MCGKVLEGTREGGEGDAGKVDKGRCLQKVVEAAVLLACYRRVGTCAASASAMAMAVRSCRGARGLRGAAFTELRVSGVLGAVLVVRF